MRTRLREMKPVDVPAVLERLQEQNQRDGTSYSLPCIFDAQGQRMRNIELALVAVDMETGRVEQGHVWERTLEQTSYGTNRRATVCSMQEFDAIAFVLRERGYRDMHTLVPKALRPRLEHGLKRLCAMSPTGFAHFYRLLDPAENAEVQKFYEEREVTA